MVDHPDLADRERDKDADRIERNEGVGAAVEDNEEGDRDEAEQDDPRREGESIAPKGELARHVASLGKALYEVFAARKRMSAVEPWKT